jgi:dTDP-4-amino-4,6-dideoxygalactose transaminase
MINVTKVYLPPIEEYDAYIKGIWERGWVTNHGPLVEGLEKKLKEYLGVKHLFFISNGTIAIQIAIKALDLRGDVVTTPFSYVATTSSISWEGCNPVFADIDPQTFNIDPSSIAKYITPKTSAILATHVFGNPCAVKKIKAIADEHGIKVIYDAAHAFGVNYSGTSILNFGDISTLSFHATKLFHTAEGGAVITNDDGLAEKIRLLRNFGHHSKERPEEIIGLGVNGKNSELHAAMGLCVLPRVKDIISDRKRISERYDRLLQGLGLGRQKIEESSEFNYAYYPVLFPSEDKMLQVKEAMNELKIFPRRYFYPSLNNLCYVVNQPMPVSEDISKRILCLPLYYQMTDEEHDLVTKTIINNF